MKRLIVNADDFGISAGINRGILECVEKGIVRSASLMANMPAAVEAASLALKTPSLGVGIHLNLTCGKPLSTIGSVRSLVSDEGGFFPLSRLMRRLVFGRIALNEAEREFRAQIERAREMGIRPTHLDSHQHLHFYPSLGKMVRKLAEEFRIPWVRGSSSSLLKGIYFPYKGLLKTAVLSQLRHFANGRQNGVRSPDRLLGVADVPRGDYPKAVRFFLKNLEGVSELLCHPGYVDEELRRNDPWTEMREEELQTLTDPEIFREIEKAGAVLTNFRERLQ
jgi:predicted glycoside hydrolase/deacetylase ChbG (UPF0249 family)